MESITNFCQNTDCIGTGAQPPAEAFKQIAEAGYQIVINLSTCDAPNAVADEGKWVTQYGMSYIHLPVGTGVDVISKVRHFFAIMDGLEGEQVFVHCAGNIRASVFMYLYLTLIKEVSKDQAISPVLAQNMAGLPPMMQQLMQLSLDDLAQ